MLLPSCCRWDAKSVSSLKKTGLDLSVQTIPDWVLWRMEGQVVLLSLHLILDIRMAAERWDYKYTAYYIYYGGYNWLWSHLFSFRDFQDWRRKISTFLCDFTVLSMWSNQQRVPMQRWVLLLWKVRGGLRSQDFQSPCPSSTAGNRKLRKIKHRNLRSGRRCHSCPSWI